jgi:hypothetical protein
MQMFKSRRISTNQVNSSAILLAQINRITSKCLNKLEQKLNAVIVARQPLFPSNQQQANQYIAENVWANIEPREQRLELDLKRTIKIQKMKSKLGLGDEKTGNKVSHLLVDSFTLSFDSGVTGSLSIVLSNISK